MPEARTPAGALSAADQRTVIVGLRRARRQRLDPRGRRAAVDARGAGQRGARVEDPPAQVARPHAAGTARGLLDQAHDLRRREVGVEVADQRAGGRDHRGRHRRPLHVGVARVAGEGGAARARRVRRQPERPGLELVGPGREGAEDPRRPAGRGARVIGAVGGERDLAALPGEGRAGVGGVGRRHRQALVRPRGRAPCRSAAGGRPGSPARRSACRRRPPP